MNYDEEMLRLYFKENNFSPEEIEEALNTNPFDVNYVIWEKQKMNNNKSFSILLKQNHFISPETKIQEINIHKKNLISNYLNNEREYSLCSSNENINKIKTKDKTIIIHGLYEGESYFLKKLNKYNVPFITGISTKNTEYFKKVKNEYLSFLKYLKNCLVFENEYNDVKSFILKSK